MGPHMNIKTGTDGKENSMVMNYSPVKMFQGNHYPTLKEILEPTPQQLEKSIKDEEDREKEVGEHFESF